MSVFEHMGHLATRREAAPQHPTVDPHVRTFPPHPLSVGFARRYVREVAAKLDEAIADSAELLASEVATNALRHGSGGFTISVTDRPGRIRIEVIDGGSASEPRLRQPDVEGDLDEEHESGGWGLNLLQMTAAAWGTERVASRCRLVWFELAWSER